MVVLIPPLLMSEGFYTAWRDFRRESADIASLALGAVVFTTAVVACGARVVAPALPWAVCIALGAIVSPSDAVAAKALLHRLPLPERLIAILEGESLVNDAAGLVIYRFSVLAAAAGSFSIEQAMVSFPVIVLVGVAVGVACGLLVGWLFAWCATTNWPWPSLLWILGPVTFSPKRLTGPAYWRSCLVDWLSGYVSIKRSARLFV